MLLFTRIDTKNIFLERITRRKIIIIVGDAPQKNTPALSIIILTLNIQVLILNYVISIKTRQTSFSNHYGVPGDLKSSTAEPDVASTIFDTPRTRTTPVHYPITPVIDKVGRRTRSSGELTNIAETINQRKEGNVEAGNADRRNGEKDYHSKGSVSLTLPCD